MATRPGWRRPTRLVAWMYSAVALGWPVTTMRPSRLTSTPTEIMFVARSTSMGRFLASAAPPCFLPGTGASETKGASSRSRMFGMSVALRREVSSRTPS